MKKMLFKDDLQRITAFECFKHPFLKTYGMTAEDKKDILAALENYLLFTKKG